MTNIFTRLLQSWKLLLVISVALMVFMNMHVRSIENKQRIIYDGNRWLPQKEQGYATFNIIEKRLEMMDLKNQTIKTQETSTHGNKIYEKFVASKTNLTKRIDLLRSNLSASSIQTKETIKTETAASIPLPTIPGFISMDRDLSLPPEIPIRPDSSEPILPYSQRRDYKAIIKHDNECGKKSPVDLNLADFNYDRDIFLLMVIKSSCSMKSRRNAIRQTWGNEQSIKEHLNINIKRFFLLGACTNDDLRNGLVEEDKTYKDVLQWDFFDSFRNLTLKDCLFMQWFSKNCRSVPYVFKGDDDVFVNVKNIVKYLKELPIAKRKDLFLGSVLRGSPRILDPSWKYYVSYNLYPEKYYPAYVSGGGFILSGDMVFRLFQASLFIRIIPIDDAFLGILLKRIGVSPENDRGFKSWGLKKYSVCRLAKIKTFHKMLPDRLLVTWREFSNLNTSSCDKESDDVFATQQKR